MTGAPMDDSENSICDASDKSSYQPGSRQARVDEANLRPECLLFAPSNDLPQKAASLVRDQETNYALSKIRSLTEGVPSQQLSDVVNRVIGRIRDIDADGFLFAGDPCTLGGRVPKDASRPLCLIWVPGLGKQLLESVANWVHVLSLIHI